MTNANGYQHLEHRPGSHYRQMFTKGRKIRVEVLYRQTIGIDPRTPEQVAEDYELPLAMVQDAIRYCLENPEVLQADRDREWAKIHQYAKLHLHVLPPDYQPES